VLFPKSVRTVVSAAETTGRLEEACFEIANGIENGAFEINEGAAGQTVEAEEQAPKETPAPVRTVGRILVEAVRRRASDVHFEWVKDRLRIRFRVDGVLQEYQERPYARDTGAVIISRLKIMADVDVSERRLPQDGRIRINVEGKDIDLRASIVPYVSGEAVTIRVLHRDFALPSLEKQGFMADQLEHLRKWMKKPNGIILVTGPTGCGKTTTLYTMLQELNTPEVKITTVEDPVEYLIDGLNQQRIQPSRGLTFAQAIRSELRQAPDIMMVSAIRDLETAHLVVQAAMTGHLVLTSLHTSDAPGALRRLLDIGLDPFLINSTVIGVVAQRLVRLVCPKCREKHTPEKWVLEAVRGHENAVCYRGSGCDHCNRTGYRGRAALHELLEMDEDIRRVVSRDVDGAQIREQAVRSGMVPMKEDGIAKVARGETTIEEVLRVCAG
jgi:type II secretory ATPase GspE/PulE/Tfp pilus assembly ATPase PilB-like protein